MQPIAMTAKEVEAYFMFNEALSDMEDLSIEWDGLYGKHWVSYDSPEAMQEALDTYQADMNAWVLNHREEVKQANIKKGQEAKRLREINTLGVQFPELKKLLKKVA